LVVMWGGPQLVYQHSAPQIVQPGARQAPVPNRIPGNAPGVVMHQQAFMQPLQHHTRGVAPARTSLAQPRKDAGVPASQVRGGSVPRISPAGDNRAEPRPPVIASSSSQRHIAMVQSNPAGMDSLAGHGHGHPPSPESRQRAGAPGWGALGVGLQCVSQPSHRPVLGAPLGDRPGGAAWRGAQPQAGAEEAFTSARGSRTSEVMADPRRSQVGSSGGKAPGMTENEAPKVMRQLSVPWERKQQQVPGNRASAPPPPVVTYSARGSGAATAAAMYGGRAPSVFSANAQEVPPQSGRSTATQRTPSTQVVTSGRSPARARPTPANGYPQAYQPAPGRGATDATPQPPPEQYFEHPQAPIAAEPPPPQGAPSLPQTHPEATQPKIPEPPPLPSTAALAEGTLLNMWPGEDDSELVAAPEGVNSAREAPPEPEKAKGQLTSDEKIAYRELQFVEHLGSGEFGQVFRGFFKDQEVAIKQLYWDNTVLPEVIIQDLTREIESFRHLRHVRLVNFVGACLEIPNLCIVTEYAPGGSLHHLLHVRKKQLPLLHSTNMCLQLSEGVNYLHSQQPIVVHRDLKSLNVVLDLNLNLKLCDFGLTESMERTHITKKNNGGSPRYMAPELFDSKSKITEKVDIWSMGCIFTEINGGTLPYEGINTLADLTREMLVHRRNPRIPPSIPEAIQAVIQSCYNFECRLRPNSKQVHHQLREAKKTLKANGLLVA